MQVRRKKYVYLLVTLTSTLGFSSHDILQTKDNSAFVVELLQ